MSVRGVCTGGGDGTAGSASVRTLTLPGTAVAGDLCLVQSIANSGSATATIASGSGSWTVQSGPDTQGSVHRTYLWSKVLTSGDISSGTITVTWSSSMRPLATGIVHTAGSVSAVAYNSIASGTSLTPNSISATAGDYVTLMVSLRDVAPPVATVTTPTDYTLDGTKALANGSGVNFRTSTMTRTVPTTGTYGSADVTFSESVGSAAAYSLSITPTPTTPNAGAATGTLAWVGVAVGAIITAGAAAGGLAWTGTASGSTPNAGASTGTVSWAGTATGSSPQSGAAAGALSWAGAATGARPSAGAATGGIAWAGTASGSAPVVGGASGSATGSLVWAGVTIGTTTRSGAASGATSWVGLASGATTRSGSAAGTITWAGTTSGAAPVVGSASGAAAGHLTWAGATSGSRASAGTATGTIEWAGQASGIAPGVDTAQGSATGTLEWVGTTSGETSRAGASAGTLTWDGFATGWKDPSGIRDVHLLGFDEHQRTVTYAEHQRHVTFTEQQRTLTLGDPMRLNTHSIEYYDPRPQTDPPVTAWQASFDGGTTWDAPDLNDADGPKWLLRGPLSPSSATATLITTSTTPKLRYTDTPEDVWVNGPRITLG